MARVVGEKRGTPEDDDEADRMQREAAKRVRVKKERMDAPIPSRYARSSSQEQEESHMEQSSEGEDLDSQELDEDGENMLETLDEGEAMRLYEAAKARKPKYAGKIRDAGIIKSITLTNFMCHRHLTAEFGPKMNFLVGHNGSGKSAILTAIAIAFGGRAAVTGRGASMGDLVAKDADKAVISLTLENSGPEAFEPDTYNPYLVIERTIARNGGSTYKFRATKDGRTLADKREVLTRILDRFGLHIDSPLTVLTQDQARSFLQASDPKTLYKFFLKGTLLQDLVDQYTKIGHQIEYFLRLKDDEAKSIPEYTEARDKLARKMREATMLLDKKAQADRLFVELAWSYVNDKEEAYHKAKDAVRDQERKLEKIEKTVGEAQAKVATATAELAELDKIIGNFTDNEKPVKERREAQRRLIQQGKNEIGELESDIKQLEEAMRKDANEVALYEAKIQQALQNSAAEDPEVVRLREKVVKLEELLINLQRQKPVLAQRVRAADEALAQAVAAEKQATEARLNANAAESEMTGRIENLKAQTSNRLNAFGNNIQSVMREIDKARWVKGKPLGPLGKHVKLEDARYATTFHSVLAQTLCSFAVRCDQDRRTMTAILQRCSKQQGYFSGHAPARNKAVAGVIQHSGERFDYSGGDLSHVNDTILSKLSIDDEDVKCILINQHSIERTMVWPKISRPNGVTERISELTHGKQTVLSFVTADGFTARGGQGKDSSGPLGNYQGFPMLSGDTASNLEQNRLELATLMSQKEEATQALHAATAEVQKRRADLAALNREHDKVDRGMKTANQQLPQVRAELAAKDTVDLGIDYTGLRNEAEGRRKGNADQLEAIQEELETRRSAERERREKLKEIEEELERLAPERQKTIEASTLVATERSRQQANILHWNEKVKKDTAQLARAREMAEAEEQEVEKITEQAMSVTNGRKVQTSRKPTELDREHKAAREAVARAERQTGFSAEAVATQLEAAERRLKQAEKTVADMGKLHHTFSKAIITRKQYWRKELIRSSIAATCSFTISMANRDLEGKIQFDHDNGYMNIRVSENNLQMQMTPDGQPIVGPRQYKTPKTMSGGERSFTTVSLLLAMWELSNSPMRCLDEWDVFLDPANRSVAAKMLLDGATTAYETQFILITPQDMNNIAVTGKYNKVIRMKDPIRNQGTLPFRALA